MKFQSPKHTRFFVLKTNNKIEEFSSLEDCVKQSDILWVIEDTFDKYFTEIAGYEWRISKYLFYKNGVTPCKLSSNGWAVEEISISRITSSYVRFTTTFLDPLKRIKRIEYSVDRSPNYYDPNSNDIQIVYKIISELNSLSKYQNWEQVDLEEENNKLKKEIIELKQMIKK